MKSVFVIFGATGDLAARKLWPAIYQLMINNKLEDFCCVGVAMDASDDTLTHIRKSLDTYSRTPVDEQLWERLAARISFVGGRFDNPEVYAQLKQEIHATSGEDCQLLCYFAVAPPFFVTIAEGLAGVGYGRGSNTRLVLEKPFGTDLASAVALNQAIHEHFDEQQLYRIDHYLGKETVQNLLVLRFANAIFEPVWNRQHISHVEITVAEDMGLGHRAGYYDHAGALLDVVQNHMMQLVSLIAMEAPTTFNAEAIRNEKLKALQAIKPIDVDEVDSVVLRAQYASGSIHDTDTLAYLDEIGIPNDSTTETYVAMVLEIDNWRWAGVPFFLRTGKALLDKRAEIIIHFHPVPHLPFQEGSQVEPNRLVIGIQPDEYINLQMTAKEPGTAMGLTGVNMDFEYNTSFRTPTPEAYERLIADAVGGDATLFMRSDEVEQAWIIVQPILDAWAQSSQRPVLYYAGSDGPDIADKLKTDRGYCPWASLKKSAE